MNIFDILTNLCSKQTVCSLKIGRMFPKLLKSWRSPLLVVAYVATARQSAVEDTTVLELAIYSASVLAALLLLVQNWYSTVVL